MISRKKFWWERISRFSTLCARSIALEFLISLVFYCFVGLCMLRKSGRSTTQACLIDYPTMIYYFETALRDKHYSSSFTELLFFPLNTYLIVLCRSGYCKSSGFQKYSLLSIFVAKFHFSSMFVSYNPLVQTIKPLLS